MREYLFRAKTIKQNKGVTTEKPIKENMWVYGNLTVGKIEGYKADMISNKKEIYYINSNTVGQFTGLTDKNGTKIFEGDILQGTITSAWNKKPIKCKVVYKRDSFVSEETIRGVRVCDHKVCFAKDIEVIGNIHDNPELLTE